MKRLTELRNQVSSANMPVLFHEMRTRQRGNKPFIALFVYVTILALAALLTLFFGMSNRSYEYRSPREMTEMGRNIFQILSFVQLGLIVLVVPPYSAGAISGEREMKTLEMLSLTLLSSAEIVAQKLAVALGQVAMLVMASLPVVGIVFLIGGVSPLEVIGAYALILLTGASVGALGLFFSSILKRTASATFATYAVALLFFGGLPLLGELLPQFSRGLSDDHSFGLALIYTAGVAFVGAIMAIVLFGPVALLLKRYTKQWKTRAFRMGAFGAAYAVCLFVAGTPDLSAPLIGLGYSGGTFLPLFLNPFYGMFELVNSNVGYSYSGPTRNVAIILPLLFCAGCLVLFNRLSSLRFNAMRRV